MRLRRCLHLWVATLPCVLFACGGSVSSTSNETQSESGEASAAPLVLESIEFERYEAQPMVVDARLVGVGVGAVAVWRRAPFVIVVGVAMATTALVRWQTWV